jgi:hypothetical protein
MIADVEVVAKLGELDMIVADLERANGRVAAVERRNVSSFSFTHALEPWLFFLTVSAPRYDHLRQEILRAEIENVKSGSQYVDKYVRSFPFLFSSLSKSS